MSILITILLIIIVFLGSKIEDNLENFDILYGEINDNSDN